VAYSGISSNRFSNTVQFCLQLNNCLVNKRLKSWDTRLDDSFQMLKIKHIKKEINQLSDFGNNNLFLGKCQLSFKYYFMITNRHTLDRTFPRCTDPILGARCLYSGVLAKYSFSLRRAAIMSTFLLISAWERLTTPIQGKFSLNDFPSRI